MKTNTEYSVHFKVGNTDYGILTIPKGTKVTHKTASGIDKNYHFVDDFSWVEPWPSGMKKHGLLHDLKYHGINVPKQYIEK